MKIFEKIVAAVFWLQIAASPIVVTLFVGFVVHVNYPTPLGWAASIAIVVLGIIGGIVLANWAAKKYGTANFISRASASPELDKTFDSE